jgi:chitinase
MQHQQRGYIDYHKAITSILALLFLAAIFVSSTTAEAAARDRTKPTVPTSLHTTRITDSTITVAWTKSKDNVRVAYYNVYRNNKFIGKAIYPNYTIKKLSSKTTYSIYVRARDTSGNLSAASKTIKVKTAAKKIAVKTSAAPAVSKPAATAGVSKPATTTTATSPAAAVTVSTNSTQAAKPEATVSPTPTAAPAPQPQYKKIGYYAGWSAYSNFLVANIDASKLTHLNYAFANISSDGKIAVGDPWIDIQKSYAGDTAAQPFKGNFYQLLKLKQKYPLLKTLITVGGWSWSGKFSDVALTDESRTIFAQSCLDFILKYGFDGVDLDWEYPVGGGLVTNVNRPEDKQNFTLLIKKIRETFDAQTAKDGKHYVVSIAAGAGQGYAANTELNLIQQYTDNIQIMTYDYHGSWDSLTGMNAPLYRDPLHSEWSIQDAVQTYIKNGVPASKLIMGIPLYGRIFNPNSTVNNGLYQPFAYGGTAVSYGNIEKSYLNQNGFVRYWNPDSKVPWLFNGTQMLSYDDVESIGYKTDFIKTMGLGGAMMWEISQDPNKVLLSKIDSDLR